MRLNKYDFMLILMLIGVLVSSVIYFSMIGSVFRETFSCIFCDGICIDVCLSPRLSSSECVPTYQCVPHNFEWCYLPVPSGCIDAYDPVIASDGKEYKNSCYACINPSVLWFAKKS